MIVGEIDENYVIKELDFQTLKNNIENIQEPQQVYQNILQIRKLTSVVQDPPIQQIIDSGILQSLINLYQQNQGLSDQVVLEILWIITNIASGTSAQTQSLIDMGGMQIFTSNIGHANEKIVEQAVWGIGNLAGEGYQIRNKLLEEHNCVEQLVAKVGQWSLATSSSVKNNFLWCMANLCRGKPQPNFEIIQPLIPIFLQQIQNSGNSQDIINECLWAISYITDNSDDIVTFMASVQTIQIIAPYINVEQLSLPVLRIISNLASGCNTVMDQIIATDKVTPIIPTYLKALSAPKKTTRKEAAWGLSNMAACNQDQIKYLVSQPNFYESLKEALLNEKDPKLIGELYYVISNLIVSGDYEVQCQIFNQNFLEAMNITFENYIDASTNSGQLYLEFLNNILKVINVEQFQKNQEQFSKAIFLTQTKFLNADFVKQQQVEEFNLAINNLFIQQYNPEQSEVNILQQNLNQMNINNNPAGSNINYQNYNFEQGMEGEMDEEVYDASQPAPM